MEETTPTTGHATAEATQPSLELWACLAVSALPQLAAAIMGGYGKLVVLLPLSLTLTLADIAAVVVAGLQLRADRHDRRKTHPVVWITIGLALLWLFYAIAVGAVSLMVQIFCINELCRGPIR